MVYNREKNDAKAIRENKPRKLTAKQERYAKERADGKSYPDAYTAAGYSSSQSRITATRNAFALENESPASNNILARIAYYQKQAEKGAILDRAARQSLLTETALDPDAGRKDRLRAIDMLCKMSGDYAETVRTELSGAVEVDRAGAFAAAVDRLTGGDA